jgi:hypothetical protein
VVIRNVVEGHLFPVGVWGRSGFHCKFWLCGCFLLLLLLLVRLVSLLSSREIVGKHSHPSNTLCFNIAACWEFEFSVHQPTLGGEKDGGSTVNDVPLALIFVIELDVFNLQLLCGG